MGVAKSLTATKVFTTVEEMVTSQEFTNLWTDLCKFEMARSIRVMKEVYTEYYGGYVVPADPLTNYGKSYRIFNAYKTSSGKKLVKEYQTFGMLTNEKLITYTITDDKIINMSQVDLNEYLELTNGSKKYDIVYGVEIHTR